MKNGTLSEYCERVTKYWWQLYKGTCEPLQEEACQIQEELISTSQSLYSFPHTSDENMDPDAEHMWYINSNIPLYNLRVDMTKLRIKMLKEQSIVFSTKPLQWVLITYWTTLHHFFGKYFWILLRYFLPENIPFGQSSAKLPVTLSLCHSVTWSLGHLVTWSLSHSVTVSFCHSVSTMLLTN